MDFVQFIIKSPYPTMSGATKSVLGLYRKYIKLCREENHNIELGTVDENVLINKRIIANRLFKLKKIVPMDLNRKEYRTSEHYLTLKKKRFLKAIRKF